MRVKKIGKRVLSILLLTSMFFSCTGCGTKEKKVMAAELKENLYTNYSKINDKKNQFATDPQFIASVKNFSNQSSKEILAGTTENISYSPISLYFALAVLTEGSEKETAEELFQALGMSDVDYDYLAKNIDDLYRQLYSDYDQKKLKIANAVWMDKNYNFMDSYGETVSNRYHSSVFCVDFGDKKTKKTMEAWIADQLNNVMQPKVEIDSQQVMTIMNTIYYEGAWKDIFWENQTEKDKFYCTKDETVTCDFMNKENREDSYVDGDGFKTYELPMEGGDSMIFCLPDEDVDLNELMESCDNIDDLFDMKTKQEADVILSLPKFDYECKMELRDMLTKLGIQRAFEPSEAEFTRMSEYNDLYVGKATQQVHITVDEEGVVGAAYTELGIEATCAMEPKELKKVRLVYNRPFLYQVISSNGLPIFTGIVRNPTIE